MNKQPLLTLSLTRHFLKKTPSRTLTYLNCPKHDNMVRTLLKMQITITIQFFADNMWKIREYFHFLVFLRRDWGAISKTSVRVSSEFPNTWKQWKHLACSLVLPLVSSCLETLMKPSHLFFKIVRQEWMISTSYQKPK